MAFGIGEAVAAGLKVLDKFVPDPAAKAEAEKELRDSLLAWDAGQMKINEAEAQNPNLLVSGWRPIIGWACAYAFIFIYVVAPTVAWIAGIFDARVEMPQFDQDTLMTLTYILLGVGGLRTFEKIKGVAAK